MVELLRVQTVVIYLRYSSSMQRSDSCDDQLRVVQNGLTRMGISHSQAIIIKDEAVSGTKENRSGYEKILEMIRDKQPIILAVDDQSRLSRGSSLKSLIEDLVYNGGRFISIGEGIDTEQTGWELRVGIMEIHNAQTVTELSRRVRRGQEGRIREGNGSAGDVCFGYRSRFVDANHYEYRGRGPKPKKELHVYEPEAVWVKQIYMWFAQGRSIGWIARELNRLKVSKPKKSAKPGWYPELVRRILSNTKYIGAWVWARTKTIRDSKGRKKQVPVPEDEQVKVDRPDLEIIDPSLWHAVQARLRQVKATYGYKPGQKRRGPRVHHTELYPGSILGGLLYCGECGARLHRQSGKPRWYFGCPNHRKKGECGMRYRAPEALTEKALLDFLVERLSRAPGWIDRAYERVRREVHRSRAEIPEHLDANKRRLAATEKAIANLLAAVEQGEGQAKAIAGRIMALEAEADGIRENISTVEERLARQTELPTRSWVQSALAQLGDVLKDSGPEVPLLLRRLLGKVFVHEIRPPGKRKGYGELHFCLHSRPLLREAMKEKLDLNALGVTVISSNNEEDIRVTLGGPTRMDRWAPEIVKMRQEGVPWKKIGRITGLGTGNAYTAYARWIKATKGGAAG